MNVATPRTLAALLLATSLSACGSSDPSGPAEAPPIDGVWRASEAGVAETTIKLDADGSVRLVEADLAGRSCSASDGAWTTEGGRLELRLTGGGVRAFDVELTGGQLVLDRAGGSTTYSPASSVPSCVSYGFGTWEGTLTARIDGISRSFTNLTVDTERIQAGSLSILACFDDAPVCDTDTVVLLLQLNVGGVLSPGSYSLGDISSGFYGLVNLFPDDPDFPGFDSLRLTPSGTLVLASIADDRIVATFQFRANERASNAAPAPDGSTFALVTDGIVNLEYR